MPDDTATSGWKRFTDKVSGPQGEPCRRSPSREFLQRAFLQDKDGAGGMGMNSTLSQICKRASGRSRRIHSSLEPRSLTGNS